MILITYLFLLVSIVAFICILLVQNVKQDKYKEKIGLLIIFLSVILGILYFYLQYLSGGADWRRTVSQVFLPIIICVVIGAIGILALLGNKKR